MRSSDKLTSWPSVCPPISIKCLSVWLSIYVSVCQSLSRTHWPTTCLCSVYMSICQLISISLSIHVSIYLSIYLSVCLPIDSCNNESVVRQCVPYAQSICWYESLILFDCLSVSQSSCLSVFRSACLPACLPVCLSFSRSFFLTVYIYPHCFNICLYVHLSYYL